MPPDRVNKENRDRRAVQLAAAIAADVNAGSLPGPPPLSQSLYCSNPVCPVQRTTLAASNWAGCIVCRQLWFCSKPACSTILLKHSKMCRERSFVVTQTPSGNPLLPVHLKKLKKANVVGNAATVAPVSSGIATTSSSSLSLGGSPLTGLHLHP